MLTTSYEVEIHAETYGKHSYDNGPDEKILEILNDELYHSKELHDANKLIDPDPQFNMEKELEVRQNEVTQSEIPFNEKMEETNVEYVIMLAQAMIDAAITLHNRNASMISMCLGIIFLALLAEGFFRVIGMIPSSWELM